MFSQGWGLTLTCANRSTLLDPSRWSGMVFSRWLAVRRAYPSSPPRRPIRGAGPCHRHRAEANPRSLFRLRLFRFHQAVSAKPPEDETKPPIKFPLPFPPCTNTTSQSRQGPGTPGAPSPSRKCSNRPSPTSGHLLLSSRPSITFRRRWRPSWPNWAANVGRLGHHGRGQDRPLRDGPGKAF